MEGKVKNGVNMGEEESVLEEKETKIKTEEVNEKELTKVKNKTESAIAFEDMSLVNRTNSLAIYDLLGDAEMMNTELNKYQAVTTEEILQTAVQIFDPSNSNTLYYYSNN
jgi:predicted Zn-dependent peptidase